MSAILAGTCKKCKEEFWISYGHPKWFDDYVKKNIESKEMTAFLKMRKSRLCINCMGKNKNDSL
jgi:hypothetical protein